MYQAKRLKLLQEVVEKTFTAFDNFISRYNSIDDGYLLFHKEEREENSIAFRVGAEKFTIHSQIYLKDNAVYFSVFTWEFDLSKLPEKSKAIEVEDLKFFCDDDERVNYLYPRYDERSGHEIALMMFFKNHQYENDLKYFFEQLEKYTDERLELPKKQN
jgi:hypothetical protein